MTVAGQPAVAYTYDNANRPLQMPQGSANVTFSFDAGGRRLSLTLPNGITTNYAYDPASELSGITYQSSTNTARGPQVHVRYRRKTQQHRRQLCPHRFATSRQLGFL